MRTDDIAIVLRPRNAWEASDLGLELARAWFPQLATTWAIAYAIPALLLVLLSPRPILAALVAWLLRPCAERALLEVLARRCFDRPVTVRLAWQTMLRLPRRPGAWLASVTWRRWSPMRTAWLAVWHLEDLRGGAARARMRVLTAHGRGVALWCMAVGTTATVLIAAAIMGVLVALLPDATGSALLEWTAGEAPLPLFEARLWATLLIMADAVCAPWVVAAQFGWYVSRRTELEAWDIELAFRALTARVGRAAAALLLALSIVGVRTSSAQPMPPPTPDAPRAESVQAPPAVFDPAVVAREILARPEFGRDEVVQRWQLRPSAPATDAAPSPVLMWLLARVPAIAGALRWVMWGLAVAGVLWLARTAWRARERSRGTSDTEAPVLLEYESVVQTSTGNADVAGMARDAIARGLLLDALGLLYRGALRACVDRGVIEEHPGDTEAEYLDQIRGRVPTEVEGTIRDVVRAWQAAAYARRVPSVERALAICDAYHAHLSGERS